MTTADEAMEQLAKVVRRRFRVVRTDKRTPVQVMDDLEKFLEDTNWRLFHAEDDEKAFDQIYSDVGDEVGRARSNWSCLGDVHSWSKANQARFRALQGWLEVLYSRCGDIKDLYRQQRKFSAQQKA